VVTGAINDTVGVTKLAVAFTNYDYTMGQYLGLTTGERLPACSGPLRR
jgi:hypothetical protein